MKIFFVLVSVLWLSMPTNSYANSYNNSDVNSWPTLNGNAERNAAISQAWPTDLQLHWQYRIPTTVTASPVVDDELIVIGSDIGVLYAFDRESKSVRWVFDTHGAIRSTPAMDSEYVYVLSEQGAMSALNRQTGALLWQFNTLGQRAFHAYNYLGAPSDKPVTDPWDLVRSSPLLVGDMVVFGSSDGHVYALNRSTGKREWAYRTGGEVHSSPALAGELIVVGSWDGVVYALNKNTGALAWSVATETEQRINVWRGIQASPVVFDNHVYIGSRDGYLYALAAETGTQKWRYNMARSWVVGAVAVDENAVYVGTSDTGLLIAVNRTSGDEIWRVATGGWTYSSPMVFTDVVLAATLLGNIVAVDKYTGSVVWLQHVGTLASDDFLLLDAQGKLRGGNNNGTWQDASYGVMAKVLSGGGLMASPAWFAEQLLFVTTAGEILLWKPAT